MALDSGAQVIVQHPCASGPTCRAFRGLGEVTPAWFCVWPWHAADAPRAEALGNELADALRAFSANAREEVAPCGGLGYVGCHAADVPSCSKILLVVFGAGVLTAQRLLPPMWEDADPSFRVVPILGPGAGTVSPPPGLNLLNGIGWSPGDRQAVVQMLRAGNLMSNRPRIFVSYQRSEAEAISYQIFDRLNRLGFEVFLDRFSIEPGVDFQVRLAEELANMGTVLVIESRSILRSRWVRHEVDFARMHRLGLVALHLPGGRRVQGLSLRLDLAREDLSPRRGEIRARKLIAVLTWLQMAHAQAERRRIAYLRDNLSDVLLRHGFTAQGFDPAGILVARKTTNEYAFRLSNLPPELQDFHAVEGFRAGRSGAFVVAPGKYMDWRRRQPLDWLSRESRIGLEDEGDMVSMVARLP